MEREREEKMKISGDAAGRDARISVSKAVLAGGDGDLLGGPSESAAYQRPCGRSQAATTNSQQWPAVPLQRATQLQPPDDPRAVF